MHMNYFTSKKRSYTKVLVAAEGLSPHLLALALDGFIHHLCMGGLKELARLRSREMEWRSWEYVASPECLKQGFDLYNSGDACSQRKDTRNLWETISV